MSESVSEREFTALQSKGFNRIPVSRALLADTETPLSAYNKLASGSHSYLFESVQGGERWGRYSIIGLPASRWLTVNGHTLTLFDGGASIEVIEGFDPLAAIDDILGRYRSAPMAHLPMFHGGWVGYFGYDTVRYVEPRLAQSCPEDTLGVPDIWLTLSEEVVVFDNLAGALTLVVNADAAVPDAYRRAMDRLDTLEARLAQPGPPLEPVSLRPLDTHEVESQVEFSTTQETFEGWVSAIRDHVMQGDVMQVVPSQRMTVPFTQSPLTLYRALRNLNPSPYLYFVDLGDFRSSVPHLRFWFALRAARSPSDPSRALANVGALPKRMRRWRRIS